MTNTPASEKDLQRWFENWQKSTGEMENVFLARSPYLAGDHLTVSDLLGVCEMMQPIVAGYEIDEKKFPKVLDWLERVKKETQPYFDEAHKAPLRMRAKFLEDEQKSQKSKI